MGLADARRWHFGITVVTYLVTLAARGGMALLHGFAAHLLLVLASEACQCVFMIMADASIAAFTDAAGYNRKRVLASLGWGGEWAGCGGGVALPRLGVDGLAGWGSRQGDGCAPGACPLPPRPTAAPRVVRSQAWHR